MGVLYNAVVGRPGPTIMINVAFSLPVSTETNPQVGLFYLGKSKHTVPLELRDPLFQCVIVGDNYMFCEDKSDDGSYTVRFPSSLRDNKTKVISVLFEPPVAPSTYRTITFLLNGVKVVTEKRPNYVVPGPLPVLSAEFGLSVGYFASGNLVTDELVIIAVSVDLQPTPREELDFLQSEFYRLRPMTVKNVHFLLNHSTPSPVVDLSKHIPADGEYVASVKLTLGQEDVASLSNCIQLISVLRGEEGYVSHLYLTSLSLSSQHTLMAVLKSPLPECLRKFEVSFVVQPVVVPSDIVQVPGVLFITVDKSLFPPKVVPFVTPHLLQQDGYTPVVLNGHYSTDVANAIPLQKITVTEIPQQGMQLFRWDRTSGKPTVRIETVPFDVEDGEPLGFFPLIPKCGSSSKSLVDFEGNLIDCSLTLADYKQVRTKLTYFLVSKMNLVSGSTSEYFTSPPGLPPTTNPAQTLAEGSVFSIILGTAVSPLRVSSILASLNSPLIPVPESSVISSLPDIDTNTDTQRRDEQYPVTTMILGNEDKPSSNAVSVWSSLTDQSNPNASPITTFSLECIITSIPSRGRTIVGGFDLLTTQLPVVVPNCEVQYKGDFDPMYPTIQLKYWFRVASLFLSSTEELSLVLEPKRKSSQPTVVQLLAKDPEGKELPMDKGYPIELSQSVVLSSIITIEDPDIALEYHSPIYSIDITPSKETRLITSCKPQAKVECTEGVGGIIKMKCTHKDANLCIETVTLKSTSLEKTSLKITIVKDDTNAWRDFKPSVATSFKVAVLTHEQIYGGASLFDTILGVLPLFLAIVVGLPLITIALVVYFCLRRTVARKKRELEEKRLQAEAEAEAEAEVKEQSAQEEEEEAEGINAETCTGTDTDGMVIGVGDDNDDDNDQGNDAEGGNVMRQQNQREESRSSSVRNPPFNAHPNSYAYSSHPHSGHSIELQQTQIEGYPSPSYSHFHHTRQNQIQSMNAPMSPRPMGPRSLQFGGSLEMSTGAERYSAQFPLPSSNAPELTRDMSTNVASSTDSTGMFNSRNNMTNYPQNGQYGQHGQYDINNPLRSVSPPPHYLSSPKSSQQPNPTPFKTQELCIDIPPSTAPSTVVSPAKDSELSNQPGSKQPPPYLPSFQPASAYSALQDTCSIDSVGISSLQLSSTEQIYSLPAIDLGISFDVGPSDLKKTLSPLASHTNSTPVVIGKASLEGCDDDELDDQMFHLASTNFSTNWNGPMTQHDDESIPSTLNVHEHPELLADLENNRDVDQDHETESVSAISEAATSVQSSNQSSMRSVSAVHVTGNQEALSMEAYVKAKGYPDQRIENISIPIVNSTSQMYSAPQNFDIGAQMHLPVQSYDNFGHHPAHEYMGSSSYGYGDVPQYDRTSGPLSPSPFSGPGSGIGPIQPHQQFYGNVERPQYHTLHHNSFQSSRGMEEIDPYYRTPFTVRPENFTDSPNSSSFNGLSPRQTPHHPGMYSPGTPRSQGYNNNKNEGPVSFGTPKRTNNNSSVSRTPNRVGSSQSFTMQSSSVPNGSPRYNSNVGASDIPKYEAMSNMVQQFNAKVEDMTRRVDKVAAFQSFKLENTSSSKASSSLNRQNQQTPKPK